MAKTVVVKQTRKPKPKLTSEQLEPGHFEGRFWIWGDGKKTHIKFIQMAMRTYRKLPPGFYKEAVLKMGIIAKKFKLKEMP
jgi:hypothetical protein